MKITEDNIELDSPEEALFYGLCALHGILVQRNTPVIAGIEMPGGLWYAPGFYLPAMDLWVEVSDGEHEAALRHGRDRWRTLGTRRLAVLYREELRVLMTRANSHVVTEQLKIWAR
jgi:hypothetical protein